MPTGRQRHRLRRRVGVTRPSAGRGRGVGVGSETGACAEVGAKELDHVTQARVWDQRGGPQQLARARVGPAAPPLGQDSQVQLPCQDSQVRLAADQRGFAFSPCARERGAARGWRWRARRTHKKLWKCAAMASRSKDWPSSAAAISTGSTITACGAREIACVVSLVVAGWLAFKLRARARARARSRCAMIVCW